MDRWAFQKRTSEFSVVQTRAKCRREAGVGSELTAAMNIGGYETKWQKDGKSMEKHKTTFFLELNSERAKDHQIT